MAQGLKGSPCALEVLKNVLFNLWADFGRLATGQQVTPRFVVEYVCSEGRTKTPLLRRACSDSVALSSSTPTSTASIVSASTVATTSATHTVGRSCRLLLDNVDNVFKLYDGRIAHFSCRYSCLIDYPIEVR